MRRLTREEWLWYAAFPLGSSIGLLLFGMLITNGSLLVTLIIPTSVGVAVSFPLVGWWLIHIEKPVSKRATDLSVTGLLASIPVRSLGYAVAFDNRIIYSSLDASLLILAIPGFLCSFYYLGIGKEKFVAGQKIILAGWLSLVYLGFGSYSIRNISSEVFHVLLLTSQVWLWAGRFGFQLAPFLMAVGILIARNRVSFDPSANHETSKQTWGEWLQGGVIPLTILGVILSGQSISVLGGLIAIVLGFLFYLTGKLVTLFQKRKGSEHTSGSLASPAAPLFG